jgi:hypothetical protein
MNSMDFQLFYFPNSNAHGDQLQSHTPLPVKKTKKKSKPKIQEPYPFASLAGTLCYQLWENGKLKDHHMKTILKYCKLTKSALVSMGISKPLRSSMGNMEFVDGSFNHIELPFEDDEVEFHWRSLSMDLTMSFYEGRPFKFILDDFVFNDSSKSCHKGFIESIKYVKSYFRVNKSVGVTP